MSAAKTGSGFDVELPRSLKAERRDDIAILWLARSEKRNALDDPTVFGIAAFFAGLPDAIKAAAKGRIEMPGPADPARILVAELVPGAFDGVSGAIRADWPAA